ncbi:hypothetical protein C8Q75DRAFT_804087 [Abortiporus biennis]|nr:hypothetical protein C8Q75DRAFT_804087 [Abortiporus biennis]
MPESYAAVASHNAPPPSEQPQPDPALLTTEPPTADNIADDASKLNIVSSNFKSNPATVTSERDIPAEYEYPTDKTTHPKQGADKSARDSQWWNRLQLGLHSPSVAGVNVGLLSGIGYTFYTRQSVRHDARALSIAIGGTAALFGTQGFLLDFFRRSSSPTTRGSSRERQGGLASIKEHMLRPGVLGGLVGLVNAGILGGLGYIAVSYDHRWDRRSISSLAIALLALWAGEGVLAERYRNL